MGEIEITLPRMGESVNEATITKWVVDEGDSVEEDDPVVEIATDKVDSEVPAPAAGVIGKKMCGEGDVVKVGEAIGTIQSEAVAEESAGEAAPAGGRSAEEERGGNGQQSSEPVKPSSRPTPEPVLEADGGAPVDVPRKGPSGRFYSPLVRNIAKAESIPLEELESLPGSGKEGRITKHDILHYVEEREKAPVAQEATAGAGVSEKAPEPEASEKATQKAQSGGAQSAAPQQPEVPVGPDDEIEEMDRMRKLIADHMVMSKRVSPHVTSYVEVDVTKIVQWREKVKKQFEEREGEKITFTPVFIEALVQTLKEFPGVNVSVDGHQVIKRKHINIGMATALPSGNLIVPVIPDADELNLVGLTKKVNDLAERARDNKLKPEETSGGTYSITNVGSFGNVMGTPVINQPQVGIMATGSIQKKPAVVETPEGDSIAIRHKMFLSHSYDHRVVDGAMGGRFVRRMADILEAFDAERSI